jgi:glycosyltransferase involved in cell wall biosynthesis
MDRAEPTFTVFIPTYNRARLLPRAFASIEAQTLRDFEVVIVDDGSTDATEALVADWRARVDFPVRYLKQAANRGKPAAHNAGVEAARGRFFVLLDSDDRLLPDTLERLLRHWESIPEDRRHRYAGVEGLVESLDGTRLLTPPYPASPYDASYLDVRYRLGNGGDKKRAVRTDILRRFPYPLFPGERHVRDSLTWKRLAHDYLFRCVNEPFQQVEYQSDGLTSNRFRVRMDSPRGFQLYYLEDVTLHRPWLRPRQVRRSFVDFIRYSLHAGTGPGRQWRLVGHDPWWLALFPAGVLRWLVDLYRLRIRGGVHPNRRVIRN